MAKRLTTPAETINTDPRFMSVVEAGRLLGLSRATTYRRVKSGDIPGLTHFAGSYRVNRAEFEASDEARKQAARLFVRDRH